MPIELALQIFDYIQFEASALVISNDMELQILNHLQTGALARGMLHGPISLPPENDGSNGTMANAFPAPDGGQADAIPDEPRITNAHPAANDVLEPEMQEYVELAGVTATLKDADDECKQSS